jgi:hypothetical protein
LVWPEVEIVLRADSGFCRDAIMGWCEHNRVEFVFGLARNERLAKKVRKAMKQAHRQWKQMGKPARAFTEFRYRTRKTWSRARRVIGKAEYLEKGENPRFVVTSWSAKKMEARSLYEQFYCARGEMENRIKEQQLALFADRTSTSWMRSNQIRLYFSSIAYCVMQALRRLGLANTDMAKAQCQTMRVRLLKIGARVRITVRKIWISLAAGHPAAGLFEQVYRNLIEPVPLRC